MHMIWVGDESRCPEAWIQTWRDNHPDWNFRLWGNADYEALDWQCRAQMDIFRQRQEWCGVADLMRYEILRRHGGFYADADSVSITPLRETLLRHPMFVCYTSEKHRPGKVANGFIGAEAGHPVLEDMIRHAAALRPADFYRWRLYHGRLERRPVPAYKIVGPVPFTKAVRRHRDKVHILPSISFLPQHYLDEEERVIYARHFYGSTLDRY